MRRLSGVRVTFHYRGGGRVSKIRTAHGVVMGCA